MSVSVNTLCHLCITQCTGTCDKITPFWQEVCNLLPGALNFPIMLSARLHPSGWFADASSPMDHRKTSSTMMKICKKRTALHCLKGQDPPPSLSKWKQKTGTGKKIALSKNHNLDQSYLFGTNSCHQPLVPNSILSRKGANVLFFLGTYIFSFSASSYFLLIIP